MVFVGGLFEVRPKVSLNGCSLWILFIALNSELISHPQFTTHHLLPLSILISTFLIILSWDQTTISPLSPGLSAVAQTLTNSIIFLLKL